MDKIDNQIKQLRQFISVSKLAYDAWWTLAGENSDHYNCVRQKFPTHFQLSRHAYLNLLIVTLYMTMENKRETVNFGQLLKGMKSNTKFTQEHIKHIEEMLAEAKIVWCKISILRSNQFAHCNYDLSQKGVFEKANIKPNEFKELIKQLEKTINYISRIYNKSSHAFNSDHTYSTRQFMDYILVQEKREEVA